MKVKVGEKVYLQKYDIAYIMNNLNNTPVTLINEIFKDRPFIMVGQNDALEFTYTFEEPENIDWLMSQDWIVDYGSTIFVSLFATKDFYKDLKKKLKNEIHSFNTKNYLYREKHYEEYDNKFKKKQHEITSYQIMIDYLNGKISFFFPKEIYKEIDHPKTSKKKPNFFKRLFSRGAH